MFVSICYKITFFFFYFEKQIHLRSKLHQHVVTLCLNLHIPTYNNATLNNVLVLRNFHILLHSIETLWYRFFFVSSTDFIGVGKLGFLDKVFFDNFVIRGLKGVLSIFGVLEHVSSPFAGIIFQHVKLSKVPCSKHEDVLSSKVWNVPIRFVMAWGKLKPCACSWR